jgi:hypothetical protein
MRFAQSRAYAIENRDDIKAQRFLMSKRKSNSAKYPPAIAEAQMPTSEVTYSTQGE